MDRDNHFLFGLKGGFQMIEKVCQTPLVWNLVHGCLDIPLGLNDIAGILPPFFHHERWVGEEP